MSPYMFVIGKFGLRWYSALIMIGVLIALIFTIIEAKKFSIKKDFIVNIAFWTIVFGLIGARLYFVAFNWSYFSNHLNEIYKVWEGGLAIHGGILFGIITVIIYCKKYKVNPLLIMDIVSPYMLLAQAIGRWGNFFNGEAYGTATTLGELRRLLVPDFIISGMQIGGVYYLPTFYFESIWCILGFIFILIMRKLKYIKIGQQIGIYMMWYSVGRFVIESFRLDSLMLGYFKVAQLVSILLFIIGLVIILLQARKPKLESRYNQKEKVEVVNF